MKSVKKITKLLEKAEARKEKLIKKISDLKEEANILHQAIQDDLTEAILSDGTPNKKLENDLDKVREEIRENQELLSKVDSLVQVELDKLKDEVEAERREFVNAKGEEFRKHFDKMNKLKIAYLESIIEYSEMKRNYESEYQRTFKEIEHRVGLRGRDTYYDFHLNLNQRHQLDDERYSPMVYNDELRDALQGRMNRLTENNKEKFKK